MSKQRIAALGPYQYRYLRKQNAMQVRSAGSRRWSTGICYPPEWILAMADLIRPSKKTKPRRHVHEEPKEKA